jgi:DNA (cytosine-5)-methyltransferase 1
MNGLPDMSQENQERLNWLFNNDSFELPNHVRPICHQDGHTYPSVYGRMKPDQPAPTLTTGFMSPGRGRFIHPLERRMLTPREAARLQGFPNWFDFLDRDNTKRSDLAKWIGDAVPSILGYFATMSLAEDLFQN